MSSIIDKFWTQLLNGEYVQNDRQTTRVILERVQEEVKKACEPGMPPLGALDGSLCNNPDRGLYLSKGFFMLMAKSGK